MVPASKNGFEVYEPDETQRAEIIAAIDSGCHTLVVCWPRRHGKTLFTALLIVWRFLTRQTQRIAIVANSERQTVDTAFKLVRDILIHTPAIKKLIDTDQIKIGKDFIRFPATGSFIQAHPANANALFGLKLSVAQISELHAARDDRIYQVLSSATIDTDDGLVLVDSTVGSRTSPLFSLFNAWEQGVDPSLHVSYVSYKNLEEACAKSPRWIKPERLRSRAAQMLPAEFAQQHLNQWTSGTSALFSPEIITSCIAAYPLDAEAVADKRAHKVGAGLDRAFGFSLHGDQTVSTAVLKVLQNEDEHFYVLDSDAIKFSGARGIKKNLTKYAKDFGMSRAAIEKYNSQDIAAWCADQDFDHELVSATIERQANAFTALYNAASEGRLHIHLTFEALLGEMAAFEYRLEASGSKGALPKFTAAKGSKDDHVYSLAWAVYALREDELNPYELSGVHCFAKAVHVADLCVLNDGDHIPLCAQECRSFGAFDGLYQAYRERDHLVPLDRPEFFAAKVQNVGAHTRPR